MNDQQTKYIEELNALVELKDAMTETVALSAKTAPLSAYLLACDMAQDGLKVCQFDESQKHLYKKFNLRIRTMVALLVAQSWAAVEIERHKELAPVEGDSASSDGE